MGAPKVGLYVPSGQGVGAQLPVGQYDPRMHVVGGEGREVMPSGVEQ